MRAASNVPRALARKTPAWAARLAWVASSAAVTLLSSSGAAWAEEPRPEDVVVRGHEAAGFVSRARIEDAPREVTDAASLIEPLPGVHVRRLGADDSFATLSVRGTSSTQVAVYLAGVPLSGGADPSLDLATLPLWPGARARVFRSFAPAALGRASLGGTLVLDAPSPRASRSTEVYGAVGAYGARRVRIGDVSGSPDGVRVATGFSASRSDDDFSFVDSRASRSAGHDVLATRENAGHAAASGLLSLGLPVRIGSKNGALTITTVAQARRQQLPGTLQRPTPSGRFDSNRLLGALEVTLPAGPGALAVRTWARREGLAVHDDPKETAKLSGTASETSDAILASGGSAGWKGALGELMTLDARIDASGERFAPGRWVGAEQPPSARRTNAGAGADLTLEATTHLTLAASARADTWFDSASDGGGANEARPTGNLGAELAIGSVTLAAHGGVLARPPSFVERFGDHGTFVGQPGLAAESARTVDAGGTFARTLAKALRLHLALAAFATWADNLIVFVPAGAYGRARATNIGRARLLGTEAELRAAAFGLALRLSHTALATANESECRVVAGACERPPLPGRPEQDFVGDLTFAVGPVHLRYGVDVVAGIRADVKGLDSFRVPDRVLHSAGARLAVPRAPGLTLSVDARNLLDLRAAAYPNALGGADRYPIGDLFDYPIPGRRLLLSARWVFPEPDLGGSVSAPQ